MRYFFTNVKLFFFFKYIIVCIYTLHKHIIQYYIVLFVLRARNRINRVTISNMVIPKTTATSGRSVRVWKRFSSTTNPSHGWRTIHSSLVIKNNARWYFVEYIICIKALVFREVHSLYYIAHFCTRVHQYKINILLKGQKSEPFFLIMNIIRSVRNDVTYIQCVVYCMYTYNLPILKGS